MQSDDTLSRAKKKRKSNETTSSSSRIRKTGLLSRLTSMPVDILFEIFGYLHPYDVLRLSRVTKPFRRLLLHKSASGVWRTARENLVSSLPDKPFDMSDPSWISLVFDAQCHRDQLNSIQVLLGQGSHVVEWRLRVRICAKCTKIHLTTSAGDASNDSKSVIESLVPRRLGSQ
ncbi:hypothetical protein B0H13DRAFT_1722305 [Mycena leptocephala]|nr:hypothetical protein B0H13DRAFT_1722305 [Mycena leptocephala]